MDLSKRFRRLLPQRFRPRVPWQRASRELAALDLLRDAPVAEKMRFTDQVLDQREADGYQRFGVK